MYFVHPQIKLNNLDKAILSLARSPDLEKLIQKLSFYFPRKQFIFTDMGRSAFKIIIEKLNLKNSEVLLPAYICDIFYPIFKRYNIRPVFLDIDLETFNIDTEEIEKKITSKSKAILICHTYGLLSDIQRIKEITNNRLLIIEDCAHSFGLQKNGIFAGNLGEAAFFSLYKFLPTLRGGLLVCPRDWQINLAETFFDFRDCLSFLNCFSIFALLFKIFGNRIAPKIPRKEKREWPSALNRVSLNLFQRFLENFEKSLKKRIELALYFQEELKKLGFQVQESKNNVFCYLSALIPGNLKSKRDCFVKTLRKYKIFCTRIWQTPIILNPRAQREYQINLNEFPNTVEAAKRIINFPLQNYYTEKEIKKMIFSIKKVIANL
ncbi:MAG: DegT/DnrJ/EryC1/StrS family aminotransferase [Patescibacteria group bacterium]|nr:DegT/DnrJ/EryC1/StrS family aminotransferase [Patescibacteria group bacterium]